MRKIDEVINQIVIPLKHLLDEVTKEIIPQEKVNKETSNPFKKRTKWSEIDVGILNNALENKESFKEVLRCLPHYTKDAVRRKLSRMGIRVENGKLIKKS